MPSRPKSARSAGIEEQAAALEALRALPPHEAEAALRKALQNRNNFLVAKAARLAADLGLKSLVPDLAAAFPRFMPESGDDPIKSDPQCWAKNDIAKALAAFEYQESPLFLTGMKHHQFEATWGGETDTAGALRGTCALALVQCREVNSLRLLGWFTELFADPDVTVQVNAARAVEQVGSDAAMLLLKLRAELASGAPELLGACYSGVLHLEGPSAIPWAAKFLAAGDDASAEAAIAIAETRTPEAFELLKSTFNRAGRIPVPTRNRYDEPEPWFRETLLSAIALTRQDAAIDFLIGLIQTGSRDASAAHEALCRSAPSNSVLERLKQLGRPCP
jgi:HEAT repeat protein